MFNLDQFYSLNRKAIIWIVLAGLIYLLRSFFTLVFLTFIIGFFSLPASKFLIEKLRFKPTLAYSAVYLVIVLAFVGGGIWITVPLIDEVNTLRDRLDDIEDTIRDENRGFAEEYPELNAIAVAFFPPEEFEKRILQAREWLAPRLVDVSIDLGRFGLYLLLAILFSFLITVDYYRLQRVVQSLKTSKLRDFYEEAAGPVVRFTLSVGRGFQALVIIAFLTTILVMPIIIGFELPNKSLLAVIVFVSSLIPFAGVIFEMVPLGLITLNAYDVDRVIWVLSLTVGVHLLITYLVAPVIFGRHFRLNPVLTLIILYVGGIIFGVWGVILGVPVATYLIRDVFAVPFTEESDEKGLRRRPIKMKKDREDDPPIPQDELAALAPKPEAGQTP